ncbi:MAG: hypothetical protein NC187_07715 [Candidatus Amulumruptor caecigallinarius]|nr:hypothetical protein [Candidatus Amulumruptor caecigallinarius]MCM1397356.1 hypothetical protein [Candidatus Amulumruptor caecigallinarius]MCM1453581.1 hypothetical protein [bacterium]
MFQDEELTLRTNNRLMCKDNKRIAFTIHVPKYLVSRLECMAREQQCSTDELAATLLLDAVYNEPNETTIRAIQDAKEGKLVGPIETTSIEAMLKSMGL